MRYAGLKTNDIANCEDGLCVSFWTQGCPHRCPGCHNPETWDPHGGYEVPTDIRGQIIKAISENDIERNFSILGGEPLWERNLPFVNSIISTVRIAYPDIKIYLWTGYTLEYLQSYRQKNIDLNNILNKIDVLIEGPYIQEQRDITLKLRGSANQRVLYKGEDF